MGIEKLSAFLKRAKKSTYASETAVKAAPQRPDSQDYEYIEDDLVYHDTYFGGTQFIGEEIVYDNSKPVWGMNYNGYVLDNTVTEAEIDKSLRGALKQDYENVIPVRGPLKFAVDNYEYTNKVDGDLARFEGREEIKKDGKPIYYAVFHGGVIT